MILRGQHSVAYIGLSYGVNVLHTDDGLYELFHPLKPINLSNYYTLAYRPTYHFNFWHSGTLALSPERQSVRMAEITRAHHRDEIPERDVTYHLTCLLIYH